MDKFWEILTNHGRHDPKVVCAAIDEAMAEFEFMSDHSRQHLAVLLYGIKWDWHYPKEIRNVRQSCFDNPGWYADVVMYRGWDEALKLKGVRHA